MDNLPDPQKKQDTQVSQKFDTIPISNTPRRKDIVGRAGEFVDDFILSLNSESIYKKMGISPDKTFLITGNPGTGKTIGIRALLNEANRYPFDNYMDTKKNKLNLVGLDYDIGKYGTPYINMGSKIVQSFFDFCYKLSHEQKVLITFDEAEVLFGSRGGNTNHKEDNKVLDTIMKNMQIVHDKPNMYVVMMSNFPDAFDEASIRAGRIDKRYEFELPNELERKLAYNHTIGKINETAGYQVVRCYDALDLSKISQGYSYADIVESVNSAVRLRADQISKTIEPGKFTKGYISQKRLEDAVNEHTNSFYKKKRNIGFI